MRVVVVCVFEADRACVCSSTLSPIMHPTEPSNCLPWYTEESLQIVPLDTQNTQNAPTPSPHLQLCKKKLKKSPCIKRKHPLSFLGCSHFGLHFTNERQKNMDSWYKVHFCHVTYAGLVPDVTDRGRQTQFGSAECPLKINKKSS